MLDARRGACGRGVDGLVMLDALWWCAGGALEQEVGELEEVWVDCRCW